MRALAWPDANSNINVAGPGAMRILDARWFGQSTMHLDEECQALEGLDNICTKIYIDESRGDAVGIRGNCARVSATPHRLESIAALQGWLTTKNSVVRS